MPLDDARRNELVFWTNDSTCANVLEQKQKDMTNENCMSVRAKEHPLILMEPARRVIMLMLHMILGLVNKVRKNSFDHVCECVETLHADENRPLAMRF